MKYNNDARFKSLTRYTADIIRRSSLREETYLMSEKKT